MNAPINLLCRPVAAVFAVALLAGCHSDPHVNVVVEKRPSIEASELPPQFLDAIDTNSESTIMDKLRPHDSLTLDGTTLTVAPVGKHRTVMLAAHDLKLINGASIVTNGNQLTLMAINMAFNNSGGIDSFAVDTSKAVAGAEASDGGRVEIYPTESVYGSLRISLPGQGGAVGAPGGPGQTGKTGDRGSDGSDQAFGCGSGGGNGSTGGTGGQGLPGGPGGKGGNGGDLVLHGKAVKDYDSHFPFHAPPGIGGTGGVGGPGGAGGPGGQGGSGSTYCKGGTAGVQGPAGLQGTPGMNGDNGTMSGQRQLK